MARADSPPMYLPRATKAIDSPVTIIGAGPHGLAAAAHVRAAGLEPLVFGDPMSFWRDQMPLGMMLRSSVRASSIASPSRTLGLRDWAAEHGRELAAPLSLADFLAYGEWYQHQTVPQVDRRMVRRVSRDGAGFELTLDDGDVLRTERVAVAAGIAPFPRVPEALRGLPPELVSHSSEHADLGKFEGRRVAVIGTGQSALESAALLEEAGASVIVISRAPAIWWLRGPAPHKIHWPTAPTDIGGRVTSWLAASPDLFRRLPRSKQPEIAFRCIRPAAAHWLRPRIDEGWVSFETSVEAARPVNDGVLLDLSSGAAELVDHVLLGTGYDVDVRRYPFLAPELAESLELADGYPVLRRGLESSVEGLHFLGAPAAHSCGPVMRFVTGTWYSAPAFAARARGRHGPPVRFSF